MPLTMNAMVDPVRPMLKCGDVKKCGDVAGSAQNVGTSKHPLKKWGRRQVVGTSKRPTTSPQPGDVPTFSGTASEGEAQREGGRSMAGSRTAHCGDVPTFFRSEKVGTSPQGGDVD